MIANIFRTSTNQNIQATSSMVGVNHRHHDGQHQRYG
jgi:hypothetical protein